jgi:hypothetical protein
LRQTYVGAQRQHQLPEGIVSFTIKGSLHGQVSFLASPTSVNPCETIGNDMPAAGRCISQATAVYSWVLGVRTMQVNALPGDLGPCQSTSDHRSIHPPL